MIGKVVSCGYNVQLKCLLVVLLSMVGLAYLPAIAQDRVAASQSTGNSLKGGVKTIQLETEAALKEMERVIKHIRFAAHSLINEAVRQEDVVVGEPDVIGPIVIPAIPAPTGTLSVGPNLPMRKRWVDLSMQSLGQLIPFLVADEKSLAMSPDIKNEDAPYWQEISTLTDDMLKHYQDLIPLTVGPDYNNTDIGKEVLVIYDDISKINKPWKELYKAIRKEK